MDSSEFNLPDIVQGADYKITVTVDSSFDLTDHTLFSEIRETPDAVLEIAFVVSAPAGQIVTLTLTHDTTAALDFSGYYWDLFTKSSTDERKRLLHGRVSTDKNVTVIT